MVCKNRELNKLLNLVQNTTQPRYSKVVAARAAKSCASGKVSIISLAHKTEPSTVIETGVMHGALLALINMFLGEV
jgi:hypothetical protein